MKFRAFGCAVAAMLLASSGAALAQTTPNQATPWQFKDANTSIAQQNGLALMLANRNHTLTTGAQSAASGSGLFGISTMATANYTQIVTQTTNNCSAAAGADMSCGGGSTTASVGQTANQSPVSSKTTAKDNTVTNNQPQTNTGSYNTSGN